MLRAFARRWTWIVLIVLLGATIFAVFMALQPPASHAMAPMCTLCGP